MDLANYTWELTEAEEDLPPRALPIPEPIFWEGASSWLFETSLLEEELNDT